jgi:hypothetical protein
MTRVGFMRIFMFSQLLEAQDFGNDLVAIVHGLLRYKKKIGVKNKNQRTIVK